MNVRIQIPSTRPSARGLSSPRRNFISTRTLSPSSRVKKIRKLPSFDTRSLIANPNLEYIQPAYILEQKLHLIPEVEALRKEVSLLRENYQLLLATLKDSKKGVNTVDETGDLIYDEMAQHELTRKLTNYQAEADELESCISSYNNTLTEETEMDLNNYVTNQKQIMNQLTEGIEMDVKLTEERNELLLTKTTADYAEIVDANEVKISQLNELLYDLRKEEKLMLQMHQDMCKSEPSKTETNQEINYYLRQLQMLQHTRARKIVDINKLQREHQQEKIALESIKLVKEEAEKKRRERMASQLIYKRKAQQLEENSRAASQMKQNEEDQKLTSTKRRKHKHKHWHHRRQDDDNKTEDNIVIDGNDDVTKKDPLNTFKTEVKKIDTLCIGDGSE